MQINEYYSHKREDIVELAVKSGTIKNVLDIGCGYGKCGQILKSKGAEKVDGIEISKEAYQQAKQNLDEVILGSAEDKTLIDKFGVYDCILCGDILEHLVDPWNALDLYSKHIKDGGRLICSIPNVRYYKVILKLLFFGEWKYQESGILDKTHLRFFSKKTILAMFKQTGYSIEIIPQKNRMLINVFNLLTLKLFKDFLPMKYYVIAKLN